MGAQLAIEAIAYANTVGLDYAPRCLLNWMALRAIDDSSATPERPARMSYMSRAELGVGIGRFMPDREPGPDAPVEERRQWEADERAVARAVAALKAVHAIEEANKPRNGWTAKYRITLGRRSTSSFPRAKVTVAATTKGDANHHPRTDGKRHPRTDVERHPSRRSTSPRGDAQRDPKEEQEEPENQKDNITGVHTSRVPVENSEQERKSA